MGISRLKLVEPKLTPWNALLAADRVKDVQIDIHFGF